MPKVLLTGATGFVGHHCIAELRRAGHEVHAVSSATPEPGGNGLVWHQCDLLDHAQTTVLIAKVRPSHMVHAAWYVTPGKYWTATENLLWVQASLHLVLQFHAADGKRAVVLGTGAEYATSDQPCGEISTTLAPESLYGISKHALHSMLAAYARQNGLSYSWGRVFIPYGPREAGARLVPHVINSILDGVIAKCSAGTQLRDFVYVEDAASAIAALLNSNLQGAVNIASGSQVLIRDVVREVGDILGRPDLLDLGAIPMKAGEAPVYTAGVERLYGELGWRPRYDLSSALRKTIDWWRAKREVPSTV